jgi:hypothetical protein
MTDLKKENLEETIKLNRKIENQRKIILQLENYQKQFEDLQSSFDKKLEIEIALKTKDIYDKYLEFVNTFTKLMDKLK